MSDQSTSSPAAKRPTLNLRLLKEKARAYAARSLRLKKKRKTVNTLSSESLIAELEELAAPINPSGGPSTGATGATTAAKSTGSALNPLIEILDDDVTVAGGVSGSSLATPGTSTPASASTTATSPALPVFPTQPKKQKWPLAVSLKTPNQPSVFLGFHAIPPTFFQPIFEKTLVELSKRKSEALFDTATAGLAFHGVPGNIFITTPPPDIPAKNFNIIDLWQVSLSPSDPKEYRQAQRIMTTRGLAGTTGNHVFMRHEYYALITFRPGDSLVWVDENFILIAPKLESFLARLPNELWIPVTPYKVPDPKAPYPSAAPLHPIASGP